jgi:hypothetical protein
MRIVAEFFVSVLLVGSMPVMAAAGEDGNYVSREEYEKLKGEFDALRAEMRELRQQVAAPAAVAPELATKAEVDAIRQQMEADAAQHSGWLEELRKEISGEAQGTTKFLVTGDATAGFICQKGADSSFSAGFSPLLLWKINDHLFFEGGLDFSLNGPLSNGSGSGTSVDLSYAALSYTVNDWLTVGGGLFTTPFSNYHTHMDASWINKLPDDPLVFGDNGIAPDASVGLFAKGAFPVTGTTINYAVYVSNGPTLITEDPGAAGSLNFDNFNDVNHNKAVGGRAGWLPVPGLEIGYSSQVSEVDPDTFGQTVHALLQALDWSYVRELDWLGGRATLRGSWVWSNVGEATYDPTGALKFGPLRFDNDRDGGFAEFAYRPTKINNKYLQNLEFVLRYDRLDVPARAPGGGLQQRWTPGLDYWLTPSAVLKFAYEINRNSNAPDDNAFVVQFAVGF